MSILLRMSSLAFGEISKDLNLYALQQDLQPSLGEGKDLYSHLGTEDGTIVKVCLLRRMRFILNVQLVHTFRIPHIQWIVVSSLHAQESIPVRERGRDS